MKIVALIPAHNEATRIGETVKAVLAIASVSETVVIDDGSSDATAEMARTAGAKVIALLHNVGKGAALETAAKRYEDADIILLLDGDLGASAAQAELLIAPIIANKADMCIAKFPVVESGKAGFGLVKNIAQRAITELGGDFVSSAPLSGQRAIRRECLDEIRPFSSGYGVEIGLTVRALRKGYRILEVETTMTHAATGRDLQGFIHRGKQYVHVQLAIRKLRRELGKL